MALLNELGHRATRYGGFEGGTPPAKATLSIDEIVRLCGWRTAEELMRFQRGMNFEIPRDASLVHGAFGADRGTRLCRELGGYRVDVPKEESVIRELRERRDREIRDDHRAGQSMPALIAKYEFSKREIHAVLGMVEG